MRPTFFLEVWQNHEANNLRQQLEVAPAIQRAHGCSLHRARGSQMLSRGAQTEAHTALAVPARSPVLVNVLPVALD